MFSKLNYDEMCVIFNYLGDVDLYIDLMKSEKDNTMKVYFPYRQLMPPHIFKLNLDIVKLARFYIPEPQFYVDVRIKKHIILQFRSHQDVKDYAKRFHEFMRYYNDYVSCKIIVLYRNKKMRRDQSKIHDRSHTRARG